MSFDHHDPEVERLMHERAATQGQEDRARRPRRVVTTGGAVLVDEDGHDRLDAMRWAYMQWQRGRLGTVFLIVDDQAWRAFTDIEESMRAVNVVMQTVQHPFADLLQQQEPPLNRKRHGHAVRKVDHGWRERVGRDRGGVPREHQTGEESVVTYRLGVGDDLVQLPAVTAGEAMFLREWLGEQIGQHLTWVADEANSRGTNPALMEATLAEGAWQAAVLTALAAALGVRLAIRETRNEEPVTRNPEHEHGDLVAWRADLFAPGSKGHAGRCSSRGCTGQAVAAFLRVAVGDPPRESWWAYCQPHTDKAAKISWVRDRRPR